MQRKVYILLLHLRAIIIHIISRHPNLFFIALIILLFIFGTM